MQSYLASWVVVLGIALTVTGCASRNSSSGSMLVDHSSHHQMSGAPVTLATEHSPTESVKQTISDVLSILGNESLKQPGRSQERRQQIEQVIRHRVNFGQMAQSSLGAPWMSLSGSERQEFVTLFVELIRDRIANKIDLYYGAQVFYLDEQREGKFAQVRTNMIGPKVDTALDFRLGNHSDQWLVYDLVIDGTSIVGNYRAQFSQIIRDITYAGLVEKMKQRVHTVKGFEKTIPDIALLPRDMSESR